MGSGKALGKKIGKNAGSAESADFHVWVLGEFIPVGVNVVFQYICFCLTFLESERLPFFHTEISWNGHTRSWIRWRCGWKMVRPKKRFWHSCRLEEPKAVFKGSSLVVQFWSLTFASASWGLEVFVDTCQLLECNQAGVLGHASSGRTLASLTQLRFIMFIRVCLKIIPKWQFLKPMMKQFGGFTQWFWHLTYIYIYIYENCPPCRCRRRPAGLMKPVSSAATHVAWATPRMSLQVSSGLGRFCMTPLASAAWKIASWLLLAVGCCWASADCVYSPCWWFLRLFFRPSWWSMVQMPNWEQVAWETSMDLKLGSMKSGWLNIVEPHI